MTHNSRVAMPKPYPLKPGDVIAVISPASPIIEEKTDRARGILEEQGYKVRFGKHAFASDYYLAGTD